MGESLLRISRARENLFKIMVDILESATPLDFANAGFFYSHSRMNGLQVTCFSCARVLDITSCADPHFAGLHSPTCQRTSPVIEPDHIPAAPGCLLALRFLPFGVAHTTILASSALLFGLTWDSKAHIFYAFLIVT